MIEEIAPHQEFKTRKQIRYEKYGIDEDEDAILNQKIHMPRRKQHEIFESVDDLSERHKVLPLRSKKAGRFEKMLHFDSTHSTMTRRSCVSRAPPHHNLLAFLNIHDIKRI